MATSDSITRKTSQRFVEEDLSFQRSRKHFLRRSKALQRARIATFLLGHNTECFASEPVYGPTGKGFLKSRGTEGLEHDRKILQFLATPKGKSFIEKFRKEVIAIIS